MSQYSNEAIAEMNNNYKQTFLRHDAGQRVLEDLKLSLGYGHTLFHSKITSEELAFQLGRQSVINDIIHSLNKE